MKWKLLVTVGQIDQESELVKPKILCFHHTRWKELQEFEQAGMLLLRCYFPQSVGPVMSHLVIYSLSLSIYKIYFLSNAEILWFWRWNIFFATVEIRAIARAYTIIFQPFIAIPVFNISHLKLCFVSIVCFTIQPFPLEDFRNQSAVCLFVFFML